MIRILLATVCALAIGLAALVAWMVWTLAGQPLAPQVMQAAVAGGFIALGWIVTFLTQEYRRQQERREMRIEIHMALRAEINDYVVRHSYDGLKRHVARVTDLIRRGGDDPDSAFFVFTPKTRAMAIFSALAERINHLSPRTTDPVVWFYSQLADVESFAEDLRSAAYARMDADRRARAYADYIQMIVEAKRRGEIAVSVLTDALGDADASEEERARQARRVERKAALRAWINSRAQDPNGR